MKKIKEVALASGVRTCSSLIDFRIELTRLQEQNIGKDLCLFTNDSRQLIFGVTDDTGNLDTSMAISIDLPCPPFCGDGIMVAVSV
jgi:hypothetical protein